MLRRRTTGVAHCPFACRSALLPSSSGQTANPSRLDKAAKLADIFGKLAVPLVVVLITAQASLWLGSLNQKLQVELSSANAESAADDRDARVMKDFAELYEKNPKLAVKFARGIRHHELRSGLLHYVIWDSLERNLDAEQGPSWNEGNATWHIVGDVAYTLSVTPVSTGVQQFDQWWECDLRRHCLRERWPQHAEKLAEKFLWLEKTYRLPVSPDSIGSETKCP